MSSKPLDRAPERMAKQRRLARCHKANRNSKKEDAYHGQDTPSAAREEQLRCDGRFQAAPDLQRASTAAIAESIAAEAARGFTGRLRRAKEEVLAKFSRIGSAETSDDNQSFMEPVSRKPAQVEAAVQEKGLYVSPYRGRVELLAEAPATTARSTRGVTPTSAGGTGNTSWISPTIFHGGLSRRAKPRSLVRDGWRGPLGITSDVRRRRSPGAGFCRVRGFMARTAPRRTHSR